MALPNYIRQETNLTGEIVNANVAAAGLEIQVAFVDKKTGEARTPQDTTLQFVINKDNSKFEIIRAESHVTADGVTTITVKADGRKIPSFGSGSGGAIGNSHNIGDSVSCVYTADQVNNIIEVLEGNFATGASELKLGTEANGDITITFENGEANKPFLKWDQAQSKLLFSNNGVDELAIGTGGGDIQSGGGTTVDGGVLNINLQDNTTFTTVGGAGSEGLAVVTDGNGLIDPSLIPYEFVTSSAGAADAGKAVLLNGSGVLDGSLVDASSATGDVLDYLEKKQVYRKHAWASQAINVGDMVVFQNQSYWYGTNPYRFQDVNSNSRGVLTIPGNGGTYRFRTYIEIPADADITNLFVDAVLRNQNVSFAANYSSEGLCGSNPDGTPNRNLPYVNGEIAYLIYRIDTGGRSTSTTGTHHVCDPAIQRCFYETDNNSGTYVEAAVGDLVPAGYSGGRVTHGSNKAGIVNLSNQDRNFFRPGMKADILGIVDSINGVGSAAEYTVITGPISRRQMPQKLNGRDIARSQGNVSVRVNYRQSVDNISDLNTNGLSIAYIDNSAALTRISLGDEQVIGNTTYII